MGTVSAKEVQQVENYDDAAVDDMDLSVPVKVKNIHIDGLNRSRNDLITTSLEDLFTVDTFEGLITKAHLCKLKLERLGVFAGINVFVDVADSKSDKNEFDVYYFVKENRPLSASAGTTVGNNEANMVISGIVNNVRGSGESVKTKMSYGTGQTSSYEFSFGQPLANDPDKRFSLRVLKSVSDFTQSYYRETARGFGANLSLPSFIGLHTLSWDYFWRENSVLQSAPFDVRENSGHSLKSSLSHTFISDGRDDWILPSKGHLFKHTIQLSDFLGNVRSWKSDVEVQLNKEIFNNVVFAATLQTGITRSLDERPLLINDRNFLGGPASIRGYMFKGVGFQTDVGDGVNSASTGGELYWASGLHVYTPLPFLKTSKDTFASLFRVHFFLNAGNLSNVAGLDRQDFIMNPRWSYGVGLMFMLGGMARLEINYCCPRNARPGDVISEGMQVGVGINFL